jgi:hypothetical protein
MKTEWDVLISNVEEALAAAALKDIVMAFSPHSLRCYNNSPLAVMEF